MLSVFSRYGKPLFTFPKQSAKTVSVEELIRQFDEKTKTKQI
ncbi:hypothetical protein ACOR62_08330 [Neisseria lisongii]|nr:hypothetical protein [Neisseria lisongii]